MKKIVLTLIGIVSLCTVSAQDRIVFKDSNEINVKVTNVSPDTVTYKQWGNLEGPTYTVYKSEILFIAYQNGTKESFAEAKSINETNQTNKPSVKFQGYGNVGMLYCPEGYNAIGPMFDVTVGTAITDYCYVGFETGFHSLLASMLYDGRWYNFFEGYIPLAVNMKGYFTKTKVRPYVNVSLGGWVGVADLGGYGGFYCQTGAGVDIKRFSVGLGYSGLVMDGTASSLYVKLGFRFGGTKY
jgi:hypothetical protein